MVISEYYSIVVMPKIEKPYPSVLDFLTTRFPFIDREIWEARIDAGKVLNEKGDPISQDTLYIPLKKLHYFREMEAESIIPFTERIIFCNEELLVACKPHFLPVTPGGPYVNECLLHRLKKRTGNNDLSPINRIDRETAGLVLFSMNKKTRGRYQELFMKGEVEKTYDAVTKYPWTQEKKSWTVENRIVRGDPWFRMKIAPGKPNAISKIVLLRSWENRARFQLYPLTGKKHQLRLHLSGLGFPILNDRYYPDLLPEQKRMFAAPLQLLARRIRFKDPLSAKQVTYESERLLLVV
ncbi:MAG: pseudouridine synthase [Deltaproteobacteria bacterium]|uniref:pseudouridine synthase n=1 Tax=Desulfobacula sp. TaxID=2593537 RepID=UPI0019936B06|nr:pseudouridine synthase [Candidatus Desulfobacula maris]MBL6996042.1 pseudouridine synthase [Desulfobacula sp.]